MEQRVSLITLGVKDLARSAAFYEEGLGWQRHTPSPDGVIFYQLNGVVLGLFPKEELDKDMQVQGAEGIGHTTLAYNTPDRESVDSVIAQAKATGARILKEPREVFWGGYSGYFADPDDHVWEVAHNPFWKLDQVGNVFLEDEADG